MHVHASCAARPGPDGCDAVLLLGPAGTGKSDLLLRLLGHGFLLVADDQVLIEDGLASAPDALAGLLEVRGLGIYRLPHIAAARLRLAVLLAAQPERLPEPAIHAPTGLPLVTIDPALPSAAARVSLALDAVLGRIGQIAGALPA